MKKSIISMTFILLLTGCSSIGKDKPVENLTIDEASPEPTPLSQDLTTQETPATTGVITGTLSYASEKIPEDMTVCAEQMIGDSEFCTTDHIVMEQEQNGIGYEIELPAGNYYVYAHLANAQVKQKAYYSEFVTCGLLASCPSHNPIEVSVLPGQTVKNINPHDWYAPQE